VYNEKFRGINHTTVFDGVCQFLTTSRKILVNIVMLRAHCHTRAETSARSVIVLKLLVIAVPT